MTDKPGFMQAVDEAFGPPGRGPFAPTYRTEGGSTRPVIHSEEAAIDAARAPWIPPEVRRLEGGPAEGGKGWTPDAGGTDGGS